MEKHVECDWNVMSEKDKVQFLKQHKLKVFTLIFYDLIFFISTYLLSEKHILNRSMENEFGKATSYTFKAIL